MSSQGPLDAGTGADDAGHGVVAWSNPGRVTAADSSFATASLTPFGSTPSHWLVATNFGFSIPSGATIDGVVVEWLKKAGVAASIQDDAARIVKGGAVGATDRADAAAWATTAAYTTYGSSSDLWGETWTDADVAASTFGAALAAKYTGVSFGDTASVDHCRITVYYTAAAGGGQPAVKRMGGVSFGAGPFQACQGVRGW